MKDDGICECNRMAVVRVQPKATDGSKLGRVDVYPAALRHFKIEKQSLMNANQAQGCAAVEIDGGARKELDDTSF